MENKNDGTLCQCPIGHTGDSCQTSKNVLNFDMHFSGYSYVGHGKKNLLVKIFASLKILVELLLTSNGIRFAFACLRVYMCVCSYGCGKVMGKVCRQR